jgi:hypothetical protein
MREELRHHDVIADFWDWYQLRHERDHGPLARHALDQCEETFQRCEWDKFAYWYAIYLRERPKSPSSRVRHASDQTDGKV